MSSEVQVLANRRNAQRSTGPRTEEGKEIVSQNAVKHGLSARRDVIRGEDAEEFERHRQGMLEDLAPLGAMEALLAGRIVSLSWRLLRAQRMENMAVETLFAKGISDFRDEVDSWLDDLDDPEPQQGRDALATDLALGRAITRDFANSKVLERLLAYEQKIEGSLYRAMAELEKLRRMRRSDGLTAQNKANSVCSVPVRAYGVTPDGVTTNAQNKANLHVEGQRDKGTEAQGEVHGPGVQNKANLDNEQAAGSREQAAVRPAVQNKANSAEDEPPAQNKANVAVQQTHGPGQDCQGSPVPSGT